MNNLLVGAVRMTKAKIFELFSMSTSSHFKTDFILLGQAKMLVTQSKILTSSMLYEFSKTFVLTLARSFKSVNCPRCSHIGFLELIR